MLTRKSTYFRTRNAKGDTVMDEMVLTWKCLQCGYISNCSDEQCHTLPEKCPDCGAPREEMEVIEED
jgi:rubrerythrin